MSSSNEFRPVVVAPERELVRAGLTRTRFVNAIDAAVNGVARGAAYLLHGADHVVAAAHRPQAAAQVARRLAAA